MMKKVFLAVMMLGITIYTQAQNPGTTTTTTATGSGSGDCLTSKRGCRILPEAGDWALGINALPILNYFGGLLAGPTSPSFNFLKSDNIIYGKYFLDEQTAVRAKLRIGILNENNYTFVPDLASTSNPPVNVIDAANQFKTDIAVGGGIEKRKGKSRIQGFYGGEGLLHFGTNKYSYYYGNPLSPINPNKHTVVDASGSTIGIEARGFIGVEYFIFPKLCIGGEFGWGVIFESQGKGQVDSEEWSNTANALVKTSTETGGFNRFKADTDNFGGAIYMLFHF